jgi:hypothetical protein
VVDLAKAMPTSPLRLACSGPKITDITKYLPYVYYVLEFVPRSDCYGIIQVESLDFYGVVGLNLFSNYEVGGI